MTFGELDRRLLARRPVPRRYYALAVPVVEEAEGLSLLFEVRAETLRTQPGEVCFPGGRVERGETSAQAALRELEEELGLRAQLGAPVEPAWHQAGFSAEPYLVKLPDNWRDSLRLNPEEVREVFTVPLAWFRDHEPEVYPCRITTAAPDNFPFARLGYPNGYPWREGSLEVPIWFYGDRAVWGLTARVVRSLVAAL